MRCVLLAALFGLALPASRPFQADCQLTAGGLCYRSEGSGATVVLIHGFQMDLREWDDVAPVVATSRRVVRYDVRGHGRSQIRDPLPSTTADLLSLLDELGIARTTLVGLSMGSTIALDFALTHTQRVDRLILLSPAVPGITVKNRLEWMQPIIEAVKSGNSQRAAELWWESPLLAQTRQRGAETARYRRVIVDNARVWTLRARPPALDPPAGSRLREIKTPLLVIAGESDDSGSFEVARILAREVADAKLITLTHAGHMLSVEQPADVARYIVGSK
jgi:pimeloyl-ACP methyl ester carboxylesterase